ncbi:response regulator [Paenibacillus crassostreae]|uniref:Two-component system response regulator n=1 Tax=Paenibacillus crassostreae TaxID=1763538 RepID=A0A167AJ51_9BACL|nr:response regulator [Paenibacillus crassostreae]AOZ92374.1 DNA-binding response regulator [Paenibacillus crassostreae]OAB71089.1 two-component system response regulator [Paenibacillus crassostreae]
MIELLLVDDESYVTESIAQTIQWSEMGISKVYQASSAAEALQVLEEQSIDIVVTDIRMPEMDGLQLIELVAERWENTRCILLTGDTDFQYAKKAIQLQAFDYILKPVNDDEFVSIISNAVELLQDEWEQAERYQQLLYDRKSDFTVLKANLMHDLLLGRTLSTKIIRDKCNQYEIPLRVDESAMMMLIPLPKTFASMDHHSISLMEYAIGNIAEEVFSEDYHIWHSKSPHDCLIIMATLKTSLEHTSEINRNVREHHREQLTKLVQILQRNVSNYLKGDISIVLTEWFEFPVGIAAAYRAGLSAIFKTETQGSDRLLFIEDLTQGRESVIKAIEMLYKPPTLIHLLESKQWESAQDKIDSVFRDMERVSYMREHLYEVFLSITNAFLYIAHKHGVFMHQIDHSGFDLFIDQRIIHSLDTLKSWSTEMMDKLKRELYTNDEYTNSYIIKQVHEIVDNHLGQDTSVKSIADKVFLHPVYLSKIYKTETGESLSDYMIRKRMERALYLLKNSNMKIYEITSELGYQNPQYFSKMFKKYYGVTPHEYREH